MNSIVFNQLKIKFFGLANSQIEIIKRELGQYINVINSNSDEYSAKLEFIGLNQFELNLLKKNTSSDVLDEGIYRIFKDLYDENNYIITYGMRSSKPNLKVYYNNEIVNSSYMVMRIIRSLILKISSNGEGVFLHASAVVLNNKAIAFTGPKKAGKTTAMLAMLEYTDYSPLTNDKLLVKKDNNNIMRVLGFPIRAGIRSGTLDVSKDICARLFSLPKNDDFDDKIIKITMDHLAEIYDKKSQQSADLEAIFIPIFCPNVTEPQINLLEPEKAKSFLCQCTLNSFHEIEPLQTSIQDYFLDSDLDAREIEVDIPVFEIRYNSLTCKKAMYEIISTLRLIK